MDLQQLAREHPAQLTDAQWRELLPEKVYRICRAHGTEPAFSGTYEESKTQGMYHCQCCDAALFSSEAKYDSGSGWPSFYAALDKSVIDEIDDVSHGMRRTEIVCKRCQSHLGHVFTDGPAPTGLRYCVNSLSLRLNET